MGGNIEKQHAFNIRVGFVGVYLYKCGYQQGSILGK